jgi:hypothetical protein
MALTNVTLLSSTQGHSSITGEPIRASGATRAVGSLYTISIHPAGFQGRVIIEGTLAAAPSDLDWFPIVLNGVEAPHVDFLQPSSTVQGYNFKGSYAWLRARVENRVAGYVDRIVLNMGTWTADQNAGGSLIPPSVMSVTGNNVGSGEGLFAGKVGDTNVLLNLKSLVAGAGISLVAGSNSVTITNVGAGSGESGGSATEFKQLTDAPGEIVNKGIVLGTSFSTLTFVDPPSSNGQVLTHTGNSVSWATPAVPELTVAVRDEGVFLTNAKEIDFAGPGVTVTNNGVNKALVTIGGVGSGGSGGPLEHVMLQYTAGGAGNLNSGDIVMDKSNGVTVEIIDALNCIVRFTFTDRPFPPASIAVMGQAFSTNEFNYANVSPSFPSRKVKSGGTAALPTLFGSFSGPITLQLRMQDTGATAGAGQRAKLAVLFRF